MSFHFFGEGLIKVLDGSTFIFESRHFLSWMLSEIFFIIFLNFNFSERPGQQLDCLTGSLFVPRTNIYFEEEFFIHYWDSICIHASSSLSSIFVLWVSTYLIYLLNASAKCQLGAMPLRTTRAAYASLYDTFRAIGVDQDRARRPTRLNLSIFFSIMLVYCYFFCCHYFFLFRR